MSIRSDHWHSPWQIQSSWATDPRQIEEIFRIRLDASERYKALGFECWLMQIEYIKEKQHGTMAVSIQTLNEALLHKTKQNKSKNHKLTIHWRRNTLPPGQRLSVAFDLPLTFAEDKWWIDSGNEWKKLATRFDWEAGRFVDYDSTIPRVPISNWEIQRSSMPIWQRRVGLSNANSNHVAFRK